MLRNFPEIPTALILAAGQGVRLGGEQKAFIEVEGTTFVEIAAQAARRVASQVLVGVADESVSRTREILGPNCAVIAGGDSRQQTVEILLAHAKNDMVLIHDVARPFASDTLFERVLESAWQYGGAVPVVSATLRDSIALADGEFLGQPLPRKDVVLTQTPYAFSREFLMHAMQKARDNGWQDTTITSLVTRAGHRVRAIEGEESNLKITFPDDLTTLHQ